MSAHLRFSSSPLRAPVVIAKSARRYSLGHAEVLQASNRGNLSASKGTLCGRYSQEGRGCVAGLFGKS